MLLRRKTAINLNQNSLVKQQGQDEALFFRIAHHGTVHMRALVARVVIQVAMFAATSAGTRIAGGSDVIAMFRRPPFPNHIALQIHFDDQVSAARRCQ